MREPATCKSTMTHDGVAVGVRAMSASTFRATLNVTPDSRATAAMRDPKIKSSLKSNTSGELSIKMALCIMFTVMPRNRKAEIMDEPGLAVERHRAALAGLGRINSWSRSAEILWPRLRTLARQLRGRPLRILDVASGGGDIAVRLWQLARYAKVAIEIDGCDVSPTAIDYAERRARDAGASVRFHRLDALRDSIPPGYDVLMCSLFLHHLDEPAAIELLRRMGNAANHMVLVNDLNRSRFGLILAQIGTQILSRSDVVHNDGPQSVRGAFTPDEALELAKRAGLHGATVSRRWPARYLLAWDKHV
jgi:2-polyprenyl-3-methyl-5-hydroxy-6-metoxy-1,4-benzoquinol methylase